VEDGVRRGGATADALSVGTEGGGFLLGDAEAVRVSGLLLLVLLFLLLVLLLLLLLLLVLHALALPGVLDFLPSVVCFVFLPPTMGMILRPATLQLLLGLALIAQLLLPPVRPGAHATLAARPLSSLLPSPPPPSVLSARGRGRTVLLRLCPATPPSFPLLLIFLVLLQNFLLPPKRSP